MPGKSRSLFIQGGLFFYSSVESAAKRRAKLKPAFWRQRQKMIKTGISNQTVDTQWACDKVPTVCYIPKYIQKTFSDICVSNKYIYASK